MVREGDSCHTPRVENRSSFFAGAQREGHDVECSSRSPSASSRERYMRNVLSSSIPFNNSSIPTASARCQSAKALRQQQSPRQVPSTPDIFSQSNSSRRESARCQAARALRQQQSPRQVPSTPDIFSQSNSSRGVRGDAVEQTVTCRLRRDREDLESRTELNGVMAKFLFGRPEHAFGAEALPRNARGTTGLSRGRAPPGGPSVLGLSHFHSPIFGNQSHRPQCASGTRRWEELSMNGVDVPADCLDSSDVHSACSTPRRRPSASPRQHKIVGGDLTSTNHVPASPTISHRPNKPPAGQRHELKSPFPFHEDRVGKKVKGTELPDRARYHQAMYCSAVIPTVAAEQNSCALEVVNNCATTSAKDVDVTRGSIQDSTADLVTLAGEKLEAWKAFKQRRQEETETVPEQLFTLSPAEWHVPKRRRDVECPIRAALGTALAQSKAEQRIHPAEQLPQESYRERVLKAEVCVDDTRKLRSIESNASTRASDNLSSISTPPPPPGRATQPRPSRSRSSSIASQRSVDRGGKPRWR